MTARTASRWSCRRASRTCSPTAPPASPSAWRPASRRTMSASSAPRCRISSTTRRCAVAELVELSPGPDFPTGGVLVEPAESIRQAYETGRGSFRLRARWASEPLGHGALPDRRHRDPLSGARRSRLIERIAQLCSRSESCRSSPMSAMNSTEDVRLVLEPKTRNVDRRRADGIAVPADRARGARAAQPQRARRRRRAAGDEPEGGAAGLSRPSPRRVAAPQPASASPRSRAAIEILRGQIIVYLNLDEVIRIIREDDDPKAEMMKRWKLTEVQAEAILNMRLRALRRLEEIAIRKELDALSAEAGGPEPLARRRAPAMEARSAKRSRDRARNSAATTALGQRRTDDRRRAGAGRDAGRGAGRARAGDGAVLGEGLDPRRQGPQRRARPSSATRKATGRASRSPPRPPTGCCSSRTNGRFYTLGVDKLPGGRGHGEPLRLMIDLANEHDMVAMFPYRPGMKLLVAASDGRGFVVPATRRWRRPAPASRC